MRLMFAQNFQTLFARRMSPKQQEFVNLKIQIPALIRIQLLWDIRSPAMDKRLQLLLIEVLVNNLAFE